MDGERSVKSLKEEIESLKIDCAEARAESDEAHTEMNAMTATVRDLANSHHTRCTYGQLIQSCPDPLCREAMKVLNS